MDPDRASGGPTDAEHISLTGQQHHYRNGKAISGARNDISPGTLDSGYRSRPGNRNSLAEYHNCSGNTLLVWSVGGLESIAGPWLPSVLARAQPIFFHFDRGACGPPCGRPDCFVL